MTMRRWMIAVAVFAAGAWTWEIAHRAYGFRSLAAAMRQRELIARAAVGIEAGAAQYKGCDFTIPEDFDPTTAHLRAGSERYRRLFFHYRRIRKKYERAARYPWLPVEPDPPWTESLADASGSSPIDAVLVYATQAFSALAYYRVQLLK
jgi:hypothetical protein